VAENKPWTNVYGLARTTVAASTALTLVATSPGAMWSPFYEGTREPLGCNGIRGSIAVFCVVPRSSLAVAHAFAVIGLIVVASGWRPRLTGVLHWWISFSMLASATRDGGDQVAALFALLLIPWTLTDPRRWHWSSPATQAGTLGSSFVAHVARFLVRLQVMVVYLHSAVTKFEVPEWLRGTAVYYWAHDTTVGVPGWLRGLSDTFLDSRAGAGVLTRGAIVLEFAMVVAFFVPKRWWRPLFWLGVAFHAAIALGLGIASFSLTMVGALVVYLRPVEAEFRWPRKARPAGISSGHVDAHAGQP
jgi:antimicrobial peptide system SdpB family protein